ncbi:MAG: H-NS family nucleoid-associated regulatory protein [Leptothrix sp. (in: b-proteobacteria)]
MGQSLSQLNAQIAKLQKAADALKAQETAAVIASIRDAIAVHGLTEADLFGAAPAAKFRRKRAAPAPVAAAKKAAVKAAKPVEKAVAKKAGAKAAVQKAAAPAAEKPAKAVKAVKAEKPAKAVATDKAAAPKAPKAEPVIKFRDEAGNSWTGHGKRPNWFKDAIAAGKTAADLAV